MSVLTQKVCRLCREAKPLADFNRLTRAPDGLQSRCRQCFSAYNRRRYASDPERFKSAVSAYRRRSPERAAVAIRNARAKKPEKYRLLKVLRNHRRRAGGDVTQRQIELVLSIFGRQCLRCGSASDVQIDHVTPIARGGCNTVANLQTLCRRCNQSKGIKHADYRSADQRRAAAEAA